MARPRKFRRAKSKIVPPIVFGLGLACLAVVPECGDDQSRSPSDIGFPIDVHVSLDLEPPEDFRGFPIDVHVPFDIETPLPDGSKD